MSRRDREGEDRYVEFQLDGKQVLIVLVGILMLCAISFYFGRRVGRAEAARDRGTLTTLLDAAPESLEQEDAGADLTFFDTVGARPQAATPPAAAAGDSGARQTPAGGETPAADRPAPAAATVAGGRAAESSTAAPPAAGSSGLEVQVAVLSDRTSADELAARLRSRGWRPEVTRTTSQGRTLYRVRVGGFTDRAAAEAAAARLEREEKVKTWIPPQGG